MEQMQFTPQVGALTVVVGCVVLFALIPIFRRWGRWFEMKGEARKADRERLTWERELMSLGIREFVEIQVSAGQLSRAQADEWYRKFSRLMIPDLLPPVDLLKSQIKQRLKVLKKQPSAKFPKEEKEVRRKKKQLIVS